MNFLTTTVSVLCLAAIGRSQANETVGHLAKTAGDELTKSIKELSTLRTQLEGEKVPMAEALTQLEDKLAQLRREHDRLSRLVDEGNLEVANIKAETKAREDELTYTGTLLDEFTRSFEGKVNVSELQTCGKAIDTAKQAAENDTLSRTDRFATQIALVKTAIQRAGEIIGGIRFAGEGVDLAGNVRNGQFALIGPVALFRSDMGEAGLVVPQAGSTRPLIRPLEGDIQTGLAALVQSGSGTMPLDPSLGGALKALIQKTNLIHIFEKGGPIMWPLLLSSVLALGAVLERLLFLANEGRKRDARALDQLFTEVTRGNLEEAIRIGRDSRFFVVRALGYALSHREQSLPNALGYAQSRELKRFRRGIPILDTVITLAPLLGLLGTVTGMMGSFSLIGGDLNSPGAITGGIAEALIATAFGLGIAITALLPFNYLNSKLDAATHEMDQAATHLEVLMQARSQKAERPAAHGHGHDHAVAIA
jgi:biopolymer transport protein ExbB